MPAVTTGWRRPARPAARMATMPVTPTSLADHLLVALPSLLDATFARSVALICQHDENGAMGVLVNQPSEYTLGEVLAQMDIITGDGDLQARMVLNGGPVHPERGFVIHDDARAWDSSLTVGDGLYLTTSRDILEAMARGEGPANAVVTLGCAGWGAGQLESELSENSWLTVPADAELVFQLPLEQRQQARGQRGQVVPGLAQRIDVHRRVGGAVAQRRVGQAPDQGHRRARQQGQEPPPDRQTPSVALCAVQNERVGE